MARIVLFKGNLSAKESCQALSRHGCVPFANAEVFGLVRIGKKMEHRSFDFPVVFDIWARNKRELAKQQVLKCCPEGWEPDLYVSSQHSFFKKDEKNWASTTIRRWVPREGAVQ